MLRITVSEEHSSWRIKLEGKLAGNLVQEARQAWESVPETARSVEVDLTGVTCIDDEGRSLLEVMNQRGARFVARGVATTALLSEICARRRTPGIVRSLAVLAALWTFAGLAPVRAQDAPPAPLRLTLKDAVALALRQNPQVAIANLSLAQSQEQSKVSRSALLPQASLAASEQVTRGNVEALLGTKMPNFPGHIGPFWAIQAGPAVSVPLLDLAAWRRWQAARESERTSEASRMTARELNAQLVVSQYLGGLRAAAEVHAAQSRLDLAKALHQLAADLQESGAGTGIDTLRANVEYQNERQKYSEASTRLKIALFGLARLLNLDPRQTIELADEQSFFETPAYESGDSLARAFAERPEMKEIQSRLRATELQVRAAQDERLPRITAAGGWSLQGLTPATMIPAYQFGAKVEIPLITSGRIQAETAVASVEMKKLAETERDVRNRIALEVKTAVAELESARIETEAAGLGVRLAREGVTQAQDRFKAGVANNIEVITAQDALARANDNQIGALYRYNQSRADLARATGQMERLYSK
ncbi:MAG: TolC family protein [Bryobacterales bacterium]|nr:TolC family protein [Bryobacterales bacterium]